MYSRRSLDRAIVLMDNIETVESALSKGTLEEQRLALEVIRTKALVATAYAQISETKAVLLQIYGGSRK